MANRLSAAQKRRRKNCSLKPLLSLFIKPKKNKVLLQKKSREEILREHKKVKLLKAAAHAPHHLLNEWEYRREFLRQNCFDFFSSFFRMKSKLAYDAIYVTDCVCFKWEFYAQNIRFQFSYSFESKICCEQIIYACKEAYWKVLKTHHRILFHSLSSFILWEPTVKFSFVECQK